MKSLELTYDVKTQVYTHEESGWRISGKAIVHMNNTMVRKIAYEATGLHMDDLLIDTMRDTALSLINIH